MDQVTVDGTHAKMERKEKNMAALIPPVPVPGGGSSDFPHWFERYQNPMKNKNAQAPDNNKR